MTVTETPVRFNAASPTAASSPIVHRPPLSNRPRTG